MYESKVLPILVPITHTVPDIHGLPIPKNIYNTHTIKQENYDFTN